MASRNVDSGWAWVILFSSCIAVFIYEGVLKTLSILLPTLKENFETQTWIIGMMITMIATISNCLGPIIGVILDYVSSRALFMFAGVVSGLALVVSSFTSNVYVLVFNVSILNGIAFSIVYLVPRVQLALYFDKYFPLASGLLYTSFSLGIVVFAPLGQVFLESYGWRSTFLLLGGIGFHLVLSGALFREKHGPGHNSEPCTEKKQGYTPLPNGKNSSETSRNRLLNILEESGLFILTDISFVIITLVASTIVSAFIAWLVYFIPNCLDKGLSLQQASTVAAVAGFANAIGHVIYIPFTTRNFISITNAVVLSAALSAIPFILDKFIMTFNTIMIANIIFMLGIGMAFPLCDVHLKTITGPEEFAKAYGWRMVIQSMFRVIGGFSVGWLYDYTGHFHTGFMIMGVMIVVSILMFVMDNLRVRVQH